MENNRDKGTVGIGERDAQNLLPDNNTSSSPGFVGICDVIAATTRSGRTSFDRSGERTRAGRCFMALRSVNGKEQEQRRLG
jgi:hypothetical protein